MPKQKKSTSTNLLEVQNAAKTLFANIRFQSIDQPIKSMLLTSSVPDEGKTTAAWYLAQAAATAGNKVLLVECDMRRRSLANMLQVHPQYGLFAVLSGAANLRQALIPTSVSALYFLDAEPGIPNPPDVLASKRMKLLVESITREFDYVIFDTPPVGTFVDAAVLSTLVDGVVLVVRPGGPKRTEMEVAYSQLEKAGANVLGLCATFVEGTGSEYYYSYYTKGGRDKRSKSKKVKFSAESVNAASSRALMTALEDADAAAQQQRAAAQQQGQKPGISVPRTTVSTSAPAKHASQSAVSTNAPNAKSK